MLGVSNYWVTRQRLRLYWIWTSILSSACSGGLSSDPPCKVALSGISSEAIRGTSLNDFEIALTFDRAPSSSSEEIAAFLNSRTIGATFFIEGKKISDTDGLRYLRESGHLIGNGSLSYGSLAKTPALLTEIRKVDQGITPYVVGNIYLFRAPNQDFNETLAEYLNRQGLQKYVGPIGWDMSMEIDDPEIVALCRDEITSTSICSRLFLNIVQQKKKGILRFTDSQKGLLGFLKELIPELEATKFKFLRLDQVPDIRRELLKREAQPGTIGGDGGCDDYGSS
jgi:peptidoglycan/xylan/chitin deacetylase (PgdA/CDA1 family)